MARSLGDAAPSEAADGQGKRKGRVLPKVDFTADEFSEFRDGAHALTDAFDSTRGTYTANMKALYEDAEAKTGVPKAIIKALFAEERRLAKNAKRDRSWEKSQIDALKEVASIMDGTPMGELAKKMLENAQQTVQ